MSFIVTKHALNSTLGTQDFSSLDRQLRTRVNSDTVYPLDVILDSDTIMNNVDSNAVSMAWRSTKNLGLVIDRMGGYGQPTELVAVRTIADLTPELLMKYVGLNDAISQRWFSALDKPWVNFNWGDVRLLDKRNAAMRENGRILGTVPEIVQLLPAAFGSAALAMSPTPNGEVYLFPALASARSLCINTNDSSLRGLPPKFTVTMGNDAILTPRGKILVSRASGQAQYPFGVVDITTGESSELFPSGLLHPTADAVVAPNGNIYFNPGSSPGMIYWDYLEDSFFVVPMSPSFSSSHMAVDRNGLIYFADKRDYSTATVQTFDTNTRVRGQISSGSIPHLANGYNDVVLAPDDKMYFLPVNPLNSGHILVVDTTDHSMTTISTQGLSGTYYSSCVGLNGNIYLFASQTTQPILELNPFTNIIASIGINTPTQQGANSKPKLALDGRIYLSLASTSIIPHAFSPMGSKTAAARNVFSAWR